MILRSLKKSWRLARVSRKLGKEWRPDIGIHTILSQASAGRTAREELFDLVLNDHRLATIVTKYDIDRDGLDEIYYILLSAGAKVWVRDHLIIASAFAFESTLDYVLRLLAHNAAPKNAAIQCVERLIQYFGRHEVGTIS